MLTMEEALKQSDKRFAAGEIVKGTIIEVRPKEVLVDIGYKSEGSVPANEFEDVKIVKVGDEIDVLIEKLEDKEGMVILSKEKAEFKKNWDKILTICNEGGTIAGKINQDRQNIVLSRRELIEQERNERRAKLLADMTPGDIRKGTVKNITDFGAFIDLNGLDGLLHITDMSWGRIGHPSEIL